MVGSQQQLAEAAQAAERHLKCKVLQLEPYRKKANKSKATEAESKEVHTAPLPNAIQISVAGLGPARHYSLTCKVDKCSV